MKKQKKSGVCAETVTIAHVPDVVWAVNAVTCLTLCSVIFERRATSICNRAQRHEVAWGHSAAEEAAQTTQRHYFWSWFNSNNNKKNEYPYIYILLCHCGEASCSFSTILSPTFYPVGQLSGIQPQQSFLCPEAAEGKDPVDPLSNPESFHFLK